MDARKFGLFVAEMRKENHMTQADLAGKINVTDKAVSRWERGLGFPDIQLIEPLAGALNVSVLELMKSERIIEKNIQCDDADDIVTGTINAIEYQKRTEKKQEKSIILASIGVAAVLSIFGLLIDSIGWTVQNVLFESVGVVLPVVSFSAFIVLIVMSFIRRIRGKSCKRILVVAFIFEGLVFAIFLSIFALALFGFPGQQ